jgi:hypothetical protein
MNQGFMEKSAATFRFMQGLTNSMRLLFLGLLVAFLAACSGGPPPQPPPQDPAQAKADAKAREDFAKNLPKPPER